MAYRKAPIIKDEIYHVFNRSNAREPIFLSKRDYLRALEVIKFYQYGKLPLRFSFYNRLPRDQKSEFLKRLNGSQKAADIVSFCLMPNHFHFLLKGLTAEGIRQFIGNFQNSYAKYFNTKSKRDGSLFQQNYKAVRIETDEQLVHVGRYIHLNPLTSYVIKDPKELEDYPWCSFAQYIGKQKLFVNTIALLRYFKSIEDFKNFTFDQVNYQRELDKIKHLVLE